MIDVKKLQEMSTENKVLYRGTELRDMELTIFLKKLKVGLIGLLRVGNLQIYFPKFRQDKTIVFIRGKKI